jgi:hypothetical protein
VPYTSVAVQFFTLATSRKRIGPQQFESIDTISVFLNCTTGWVRELFYHNISEQSKYCFLQAQCTPSMNINSEPHKVWVCIEKTTGRVQSAYCTCFAGYYLYYYLYNVLVIIFLFASFCVFGYQRNRDWLLNCYCDFLCDQPSSVIAASKSSDCHFIAFILCIMLIHNNEPLIQFVILCASRS